MVSQKHFRSLLFSPHLNHLLHIQHSVKLSSMFKSDFCITFAFLCNNTRQHSYVLWQPGQMTSHLIGRSVTLPLDLCPPSGYLLVQVCPSAPAKHTGPGVGSWLGKFTALPEGAPAVSAGLSLYCVCFFQLFLFDAFFLSLSLPCGGYFWRVIPGVLIFFLLIYSFFQRQTDFTCRVTQLLTRIEVTLPCGHSTDVYVGGAVASAAVPALTR